MASLCDSYTHMHTDYFYLYFALEIFCWVTLMDFYFHCTFWNNYSRLFCLWIWRSKICVSIILLNVFFREGDTAKIYVNIAAYIIWAFAGLYLLVLMCLCMNIRISIAVLKTSASFLSANLKVFIVPFFAMIFAASLVCGWVVAAVYLFSCGTIVPSSTGT